MQLIRILVTCSGSREARVLPACRAISVCCSTVGPGGVNNTNIKHKSSNHNKKIQMLWVVLPCTCRFHFREKGANFLPFHNVCDDVTGDFWICAIGNDYWGATLQCPEGCFHLSHTTWFSVMQHFHYWTNSASTYSEMNYYLSHWPLLPCRRYQLWI